MEAFQDHYDDAVAHCYGCGRNNEHGHQIKTCWEGEETVTRFTPEPYHTAVPGFVYGGLIASLVDCHSTGSAAAAMYRQQNRELGSQPPLRFVTGSLHVDYLKPTPLDGALELRGRIVEIKGRKVVVETDVIARGEITARGRVVAVEMPVGFGGTKPA
ncbi:PaaI family thioesterase [Rhodopseudomonas pseudopalustris]|jgi:acyl-coenzyme A thioesterase PaaI-like protein|uniref:PaaI family thioesterase n=1 Tax=Rhodopseudomonas pseudopalustris TaxID=1513892 RepID=UPI000C9F43BE